MSRGQRVKASGGEKNAAGKLRKFRSQIDRADGELLAALGRRFRAVKGIGKIKARLGLPVVQKGRWSEVMKTRQQKARRMGLSADLIEAIYRLIHKEAIRLQKAGRKRR